jgi:hypothetical protein
MGIVVRIRVVVRLLVVWLMVVVECVLLMVAEAGLGGRWTDHHQLGLVAT